MRILALETSRRKLKNQFIAEGEKELLSTTHHIFVFLIPLLWIVPVTIALLFGWATAIALGMIDLLIITLALYLWFLSALVLTINAFIAWRYNFLIITTEKIVIVEHAFIFKQTIHPIHMENIASIQTESRFLGIGHCGNLLVNLNEMQAATNGEVHVRSIPKPEVIAGAIENARVLTKQRVGIDAGPEAQEQKMQQAQQKAVQEIKAP